MSPNLDVQFLLQLSGSSAITSEVSARLQLIAKNLASMDEQLAFLSRFEDPTSKRKPAAPKPEHSNILNPHTGLIPLTGGLTVRKFALGETSLEDTPKVPRSIVKKEAAPTLSLEDLEL